MAGAAKRICFDANILVYTVVKGDPRSDRAAELLLDGGGVSVQALHEFAVVAHRKFKMSWQEIHLALGYIRGLCRQPVPTSVKTHLEALRIAERYQCQGYDALIIAAALEDSADTLYTEDMQHGQKIEGLTIRNPFR